MKKLSETLTELGIAFSFPIIIKDSNGKVTYFENSDGYCSRTEYDDNGKETYYDDSDSFIDKKRFDENGTEVYLEDGEALLWKQWYN